ncbi:hypothetical protein BC830DRAFT_1076571 [Chytriomyces sp. MP71]|nr:hypothetical protein BC830DRAFT_1076571 [Chytriomyces sp. MP71]
MAFFNKQGTLWKSLLNLSGQRSQLDPLDSLHNAAAANRVLIAEESVRPSLRGVLAIKIRMASLIKFDNGHQTGGFFVEFSIRSLVKRTQVAQNNEGILKWDQTKHFPIALVRNPKHPYNMLSIRLFSYDAKSSTDVSEVGSLSFHLHDIIKANPIAGTYDLWNANIQVGDIDLEFTFSYGSFGYGYSPQLREEDMSPEEIVTYSLFPRVIPRRDQREPEDPVMVVCATPHPRFIHFKEKVYLSYGREIREQLEEVAETMYRPDMLEQEMSDFEQVRDEVGNFFPRIHRTSSDTFAS